MQPTDYFPHHANRGEGNQQGILPVGSRCHRRWRYLLFWYEFFEAQHSYDGGNGLLRGTPRLGGR